MSGLRVACERRLVLDSFNAHFMDSQVTAVIGPSGSGKTTLLSVISGEVKPEGGVIKFCGTSQLPVAFVTQNAQLLGNRTALDNVALGNLAIGYRYDDARRTARRLLDRLSLEHLSERKAHQLSGGERQRVAILRAIARRSSVLLADEPTAALDLASREAVVNALLLAAAEGVAVVVATHDEYVARSAHAVVKMPEEQ